MRAVEPAKIPSPITGMLSNPMPNARNSTRCPLVVLLLFAGSGFAALIYEIVWFQMLQLVIGSTAVSMAALLGTFMGGMCLGSFVLPRVIRAELNPLRVYAWLEIGIALMGILLLFMMPYAGGLYIAVGGTGFEGILLRGLICAICLLPSTLLMGATLPAIARWVETTPDGISWLGFFYSGNIAGAVLGSLLAGFYLLRVYDLATATYVAAAVNIAVALIGLLLAARVPRFARTAGYEQGRVQVSKTTWTVYVAIALSGMCALGAEVVWTRLLSLLLGGSVYTFSIILAVFLCGLGIGGTIGSVVSGRSKPRLVLGICQTLLILAIAWAANMIVRFLPYWPIDPFLSVSSWFTFQMDLFHTMVSILPAAILWGASFPLALAAAASGTEDAGRLVGGVYAANTIGAIAGAILFNLVIVNWIGTPQAQKVLIGLTCLAALLMLMGRARTAFVVAVPSLAFALAFSVPPVSGNLVAYGRFVPRNLAVAEAQGKPTVVYIGEGVNASVAVSTLPSGVRNFHVSGRIEASTQPQDMRLQRLLGHIAALNHPEPRSVLIVGLGSGMTAGTFTLYPTIERIVICEIEPLIPEVVATYFSGENNGVLHDPRVEVIYDDARHYILTTKEKFDIITSDPVHPWIKGSAALYTREYFELAKRHLNPGGVISQWVPLYESSIEATQSELATFFQVFPEGSVWGNDINGVGYDIVLLGKDGAQTINVDQMHERLNRPDHRQVARSLQDVGFKSVIELLATYAGRGRDLASWFSGAQINLDRNQRLQYLAGMGLNLFRNEIIYNDLLTYRRFPEDLFISSDIAKKALRDALARTKSAP